MGEWAVPGEGWSREGFSILYWKLEQSELKGNKLDLDMIDPSGLCKE